MHSAKNELVARDGAILTAQRHKVVAWPWTHTPHPAVARSDLGEEGAVTRVQLDSPVSMPESSYF